MAYIVIFGVAGFIILWRRQSRLENAIDIRLKKLETALQQFKEKKPPGWERKAEKPEPESAGPAKPDAIKGPVEPEKPISAKPPDETKAPAATETPPPLPPDSERKPPEKAAKPETVPPEQTPETKPAPAYGQTAKGSEPDTRKTAPERPAPPKVSRPAPKEPDLKRRWDEFLANVDWEMFTGVKLFGWLGGFALFIGAILFVKLSIDRNLIPPSVRLAIGALAGIGIVVSAFRFDRARYEALRHTLAAGGICVLYAVVFAATIYYQFLAKPFGFGLLCLVSAAAFVLAVYHRGLAISILGGLGAYLTPLLVNTGRGGLGMLFAYLVVVNVGLFEVMRRLASGSLLLFATAGTVGTLLLGTFGRFNPSGVISVVWILNLALFSFFVEFMAEGQNTRRTVSWAWNVLYWSVLAVALISLDRHSATCIHLATAAMVCANALAFFNRYWYPRFTPYSVFVFLLALAWAVLEFDARTLSWQFAMFLLYGAAGGIGPVVLIQKYGLDKKSAYWLRIFPLALVLLSLGMLLKWPVVDFWFWPMVILLQMLGILISLILGAIILVGLLTAAVVAGAIFWVVNAPPIALGPAFFAFLLVSGAMMLAAIYLALRYLINWMPKPEQSPSGEPVKDASSRLLEWMKASPALGAFVLLGVTFMVQRPLEPLPGMVTLACFTAIAIFLGKRIDFPPLIVVSLLAAALAEYVWMAKPPPGTAYSSLIWASAGFLAALVLPFFFFTPAEKWDRPWMAWSVFELFQAVFAFLAADFMWGRHVSGCLPAVMAVAKMPAVYLLLKRLEGKKERNAILAFHGGILLLYVSSLPAIWLEQGWLGLSLVFESAALLWLNRRIVHPGLRWVAAVAAPFGLFFILLNIGKMKGIDTLPILNGAVIGVAMCVPALIACKTMADYPTRRLSRWDLPHYFLWLALGTGFFLINISIADLFGATGQSLAFSFQRNFSHAMIGCLAWSVFGAALWRFVEKPAGVRIAGLVLLCAGTFRMVLSPLFFPFEIAGLIPVYDPHPLGYFAMAGLLFYLCMKERPSGSPSWTGSLFLALFIVCIYCGVRLAATAVFQPGGSFNYFFGRTLAMATMSAAAWLAYGLALLRWPKTLERPFRIAGMVLILAGMLKAAWLPLWFRVDFGAMKPVLNFPALLYGFCIAASVWMVCRKEHPGWPFEKISPRSFWGVVVGVFSFWILNVEIASVFGENRYGFTFSTGGSLAHQLAYSLGWLLFATGLLAVGIRFDHNKTRWTALIMLAVTSVKIFFKDLWSLGQLYRVTSFVGLAAVLILVSFLYQRYLSKGKKDEK